MGKVYFGECRRGFVVRIPCNWVKDGFCGVDARPCVFECVHEVGVDVGYRVFTEGQQDADIGVLAAGRIETHAMQRFAVFIQDRDRMRTGRKIEQGRTVIGQYLLLAVVQPCSQTTGSVTVLEGIYRQLISGKCGQCTTEKRRRRQGFDQNAFHYFPWLQRDPGRLGRLPAWDDAAGNRRIDSCWYAIRVPQIGAAVVISAV